MRYLKMECFTAVMKIIAAVIFFNFSVEAQDLKHRWSNILSVDQSRELSNNEKNELTIQAYKIIHIYGYPNFEEYKLTSTPIVVWIHCLDNSLKWNTFPMLYKGYNQGLIDHETMVNYILRAMYLGMYCRYPTRIYNPSRDDVDSIVNFFGLITEFLPFDMLTTNPTPFDSIATIPNDAELIGSWLCDKEPFYYKLKFYPPIEIQILKHNDEYFYMEKVENFIPQKLRYEIEDEIKYFNFVSGDFSYIKVDENGSASWYTKQHRLIYEFIKL